MNDSGPNEITPIVHNGVMFLLNPGNVVQAINAQTGDVIWENRIGPAAGRPARSVAIYKDKLFFGSSDAKMYALDAQTGRTLWTTDRSEFPRNYCTPVVWEFAGRKQLVMAETLKYSLRRQRPFEGDGSGPFFQSGGTSFPSEHAAAAWSIAGVVALVNARHLLYSAAIAPYTATRSRRELAISSTPSALPLSKACTEPLRMSA